MRLSAAGTAGLVVTGGRRLRTLLGHSVTETGLNFRLFPLSVLLDGETSPVDRQRHEFFPGRVDGKSHLTKLLLHYLHYSEDSDYAVAAGRCQWEPFVRRLAADIGEGLERRLLCYLIERGKPVNPTKAQSDTGIRDIKAVADTLVYLGVISRWIRNEEATLFAGCRLLNNHITSVDPTSE